jgi:soluble lytic murein transglycosylase-like protein
MKASLSRARVLIYVAFALVAAACTAPGAADAPELSTPPADPALQAAQASAESPAPSPAIAADQLTEVKRLLTDSAHRHGVNPYLVMAVAWWESGWNQSKVSATGAIGIMQVEPATADSAGPLLLHRSADVHVPADNIELGTAVLREDLDRYQNDATKALVAYYAGPDAVKDWKDLDPNARRYVLGVLRLAVEFSRGAGPA